MIIRRKIGSGRTLQMALVAALALAVGAVHPAYAAADDYAESNEYCTPAIQQGIDRSPSFDSSSAEGCRYSLGTSDTSPSVQVMRDGTLFVARASGGVLRSTDDGSSWTDIPIPSLAGADQSQGATHGYVHSDPRTDRIYYSTSLGAPSCGGLSGAVVSWSDDLGATWTSTPIACDTFDWGKIVTGPAPEGNPYPSAAYFLGVGVRPVGGQRIVYRSLDAGATWQRMNNIASATTEAGVGVAASDGTVYFDYPEFIGFDPARIIDRTYPFDPARLCHQMISVSEDFGTSWRQEAVPGSNTCFSLYGQQRVAVDSDGTLYTIWVDDADAQLYLSTSHDRARTWSAPVDMMPVGATYSHTHANIVAAESGHVTIAASMTSDPVDTRLAVLSNRSDYSSYLIESFDANSPAPHLQTVKLDPDDDPSVRVGEDHNEANAYLGVGTSGDAWAVFSRHAPSFGAAGDLVVARMVG